MDNKLARLIELIHKMPENCVDKLLEQATEMVDASIKERAKKEPAPPCPHCESQSKRNGKKRGKQQFLCKSCNKTFGFTTNTAISNSTFGEAVWKQIIRDTIAGVSLADTAGALMMHRDTAFNMRHKLLLALEAEETASPSVLSGVCELDDTYVLESHKGTKLPEGYWRKPRKHGAKAQSRGLSREYVAICTAAGRDGENIAKTVNRATPTKAEISEVYAGKISEQTLILCDGAGSFGVLKEEYGCEVTDVFANGRQAGFYNLNTANGFHSFIKARYNQYRGVATKYLNRYNALFAKLYRSDENLVDELYNILCKADTPRHRTVKDVKTASLLAI